MKQITIRGNGLRVEAHQEGRTYIEDPEHDDRRGGGWLILDARYTVTVEDVPDPLPTEPGTHIIATVTRGQASGRVVLCKWNGSSHPWHSTWPVDGYTAHAEHHISDWRVLNLDEVTP